MLIIGLLLALMIVGSMIYGRYWELKYKELEAESQNRKSTATSAVDQLMDKLDEDLANRLRNFLDKENDIG